MTKNLHHEAWSALACSVGLCFGLILVACGDSSSGSDKTSGKDGVAEYGSVGEMVHCTKSHYGEIAYVVETDSFYKCTSDGWGG
ncbi:MAG: hypothetical protein HUK20_10055 [Fibrobacter sp.]|nr:hypothetical protein [Fibrobacter sp.]